MEINKDQWNKFILENRGSFLQSYEWGEFQRAFGRRVFRLRPELDSGSSPDWAAQFIEIKLPLGKKYFYCPRGPLFPPSPKLGEGWGEVFNDFINKIKELAQKESTIFFRIGPEITIDQLNNWPIEQLGFQQLPYDIEPSQTLILDITKSEDELLARMHEKTRYNIRLAERKGVKTKMVLAGDADFEKYFEEFYKLVDEGTAARKEIRHHPKEHYKKQLMISRHNFPQPPLNLRGGEAAEAKAEAGEGELEFQEKLFVAEYENQVIAANILAIFGKTATYLHGATSGEHREIMAPHLLQWEQIRYAKSHGCVQYDFWGIVNERTRDKRGKSWEGFTRFKKGFGGREVNYIGYWDYPLDKFWYAIYRGVQKFRR